MSDAIVYVDSSEVREGALDELKAGLEELAEFIEANEPRLIAYNIYFSDDGTKMTVVNVHPDSASLEVPHGGGGAALSPVRGARDADFDPHLRRAERESLAAGA
ncbi:MAG TPA: hypothetical protein VHI55_02735 [Gaiellaceae bacterium]|jgi:hypothetical protein|nr:hypothetical protein [Gaiellaceae bacterium]